MEIYDPATDTWRDGAEMPPPAEPAAADGAYSGHNGVAAQVRCGFSSSMRPTLTEIYLPMSRLLFRSIK
eukprot:COSAG01_NODE_8675_length_2701_cov_55.451576_2_plen_69_part_00